MDGSIERPTGPGLGIEVDEREVRRAAERGHAWRTPLWRHPDASLAAWSGYRAFTMSHRSITPSGR